MAPKDDQEQARNAPRESEELYRLLAEYSTEIVSKHTPEGVYTYASPACRSLLGYEPEELVGCSAYEYFHPEDLEWIRSAHSAILELPDVHTVSYRIRRKDGSYTWFETTSRTVRDPETDEVCEIIAVSRDINERKQVEEALRESQEALRESDQFHRFAVEAGRIGTWDLDLRTEECLISPKMAELMDFSPDKTSVPGSQWRESILPDDRNSMASALDASIERDAPFELEFRIALKDGTERWLYSCGSVTRDASGNALRVHGASIDVTERKRAEEALRDSEERYRTLFDSIDEGFGIIEMLYDERGQAIDYRILETNPTFGRMTGFADAVGKTSLELNPAAEPYWFETLGRVAQTGEDARFESYAEALDRWFDVYASRVGGEGSRRVAIVFANTTERKRAEEALRDSEERYRSFFETAAVGAAEADLRTGRFVRVNDNLCRFLGYSRDELLTMTFLQVTHPDDRASNSGGVDQLLRGEIQEYVTEKRYLRKDGGIVWAQLAVALVRDRDGRPLHSVAITQDITERKRVEEALAREVQAKSSFLADISHELRTPLTVIQGNAEVGLELGRDCEHGEILEEIARESGSISRMVEDLLFLARSDSDSLPLDRQNVSVEQLLGGLARRVEALARKHGAALRSTLSGEGHLRCDAQRIEQAALILVENAAKYGPPGEPITLCSSTRQGELLMEVADRGPGIPQEVLPHIFERFYRGEDPPEEQGSGLGLAIAKTIAEAHGGSVEIESHPGEGTRMSLHLPLIGGP